MKKVMASIHIGGGNFRNEEISVYTREEASEILSNKDWEIGEDAYDPKRRNNRIATGFDWKEDGTIVGIYMEV